MSLFNKYNFDIRTFAGKNCYSKPEVEGVFITPNETIATDSFSMIKVASVSGTELTEYPAHPDGKKILRDFNSFILPTEKANDVLGLFKKVNDTLPIINNAVILKSNKGQAEIGKTDLESFNSVNSRTIEGQYPKYKELYSKQRNQKCIKVVVNAKFLRKIANFYSTFCDDFDSEVEISIPIKKNGIIGFRAIRKSTNQNAEAILMPISTDRISDVKKLKRKEEVNS